MANISFYKQILNLIPPHIVIKSVKKYNSDHYSKGITTYVQMMSMMFCQFSKSNSLREIEFGMHSTLGDWNHLGITKLIPKRTNLAYNNENRTHEVFRDIYYSLMEYYQEKGELQRKKFKEIDKKIYILDSTVISLSMKLFDWAKYQTTKGAIKLHTMLDYDGCLPSYIFVRPGKYSDLSFAKYHTPPKNSVIMFDRGYQDYKLFYKWNLDGVTFVTRLKKEIKHTRKRELPLSDKDSDNILVDEVIELTGDKTKKNYPGELRRVAILDEKHKDIVEVLTNNFSWTAETISQLYKERWRIEIFFRYIKQNLKIKSFLGRSENAVFIQIWTALITFLLLKLLQNRSKYKWHLSNLVHFIRLNLFCKFDIYQWLDDPIRGLKKRPEPQPSLFPE
jgi:hypothetical protein